jgi:hypothetical protein
MFDVMMTVQSNGPEYWASLYFLHPRTFEGRCHYVGAADTLPAEGGRPQGRP